jgi:acetyl esterase
VVNFHGGGFVLGSARQGDWLCSTVADELDAVVVSVDYRLAPTHRFPAAVEDCQDALGWVAEHAASLGGDAARIGVMGDSAGGNLAAVVSILARDAGGPQVAHQALIYPATDMTDALRQDASYLANTRGIVLSNEDMDVFAEHYVGGDGDPSDWRLSPILAADLGGLPPAVVVVAGLDPLHDSGVRYAQALADAGTEVRVEDFHQMPHGFVSFPYFCAAARPAVDAIVASQRRALRGRAAAPTRPSATAGRSAGERWGQLAAPSSLRRSDIVARLCSWLTRDSVTPSTLPISASVSRSQ